MMSQDRIERIHDLTIVLNDAIGYALADFLGKSPDKRGLELVGEEITDFMGAIGPLFVRIAVNMGMTKQHLLSAIEGSWTHAAGSCDCEEMIEQ